MMQGNSLTKYKVGLLVAGVFTLVLLGMVLVQASATKQDAETDRLASSAADRLNSYTEAQFAVPDSLQQAGVTKQSPNISYTKLSESKYKFCETYKTTSSGFDPSSVAADLATGGNPSAWDSAETGSSSFLIIPTSHHKGVNCQTIDTGSDITTQPDICGGALAVCSQSLNDSSNSDSSSLFSSAGAADSERETDIDALDAHLEAYYANNGYYPTRAELNNASWVPVNMVGLDAAALCDPSSKATSNCTFAASSQKGVYSYKAMDASGQTCTVDQNCASFTLTAVLSTGDQFTKQSNT